MTIDGHDGYIFYTAETTYGNPADDRVWERLLEVHSVSGRGASQEVKDMRRHGKRGRSGSPRGKRDEDALVFELSMVDDAALTNTYDVFLQSIFEEDYDVAPTSYTFLIANNSDPASATFLEYYYGCMLDELELTIEEGEPIALSLSFIKKNMTPQTSDVHLSPDVDIDCTGNTVTFADANPDTITRTSGSWITDGFVDGDIFTVTNSTSNDGTYTIADTAALVLTLVGGDALAAETNTTLTITFKVVNAVIDCTGNTVTFADANPDTITRTSGSWITDGFADGHTITVLNSTSNDGTYTIATVTALAITLIAINTLAAETNSTETQLTFDALVSYMAYPSAITYLMWSDASIAKSGGTWANTGILTNISSMSCTIAQGGEKKFRINRSKTPKDVHFGSYEVSGSMTIDYDDLDEITELTDEKSGNVIITITPTAGLVATITLVNTVYESVPYDSEPNSMITMDIDFSADEATFA